MKKLAKIVFFSALGLFLIGLTAALLIIYLVPADELENIQTERETPTAKTTTPPLDDKISKAADYEELSKMVKFMLTPNDLIDAYKTDPEAAETKYRRKFVGVRGNVVDFIKYGDELNTFYTVLLNEGNSPENIGCSFDRWGGEEMLLNPKKGQEVFIAGRVTTKDDKVLLYECIIAKTQQ